MFENYPRDLWETYKLFKIKQIDLAALCQAVPSGSFAG